MCSDHLPGQLSVMGFVRIEQAGVSQATEHHHPPDCGEADDPGALSLVESTETRERAEDSSRSHKGNSSPCVQRFRDLAILAGHGGPYRQNDAKSKEECGGGRNHPGLPPRSVPDHLFRRSVGEGGPPSAVGAPAPVQRSLLRHEHHVHPVVGRAERPVGKRPGAVDVDAVAAGTGGERVERRVVHACRRKLIPRYRRSSPRSV